MYPVAHISSPLDRTLWLLNINEILIDPFRQPLIMKVRQSRVGLGKVSTTKQSIKKNEPAVHFLTPSPPP